MLHIETLPPIPSNGRLIIIGDVHGCPRELDNLLEAVKYKPDSTDVLLFVGDLVNKGYDSAGVVQRAIKYKAKCVLGNHDVSLLARCDLYKEGVIDPNSTDPMDQTAMTFPQECYDYLHKLPHIIRVPQFKLVVVHAGLNPKSKLEDQNLWEILHMRRILGNGRIVDAHSGGDMWAAKWKGPETIVFGHDARKGFQKHPFAIGLDTGCCYGAQLTALVLPKGELVKVEGSKVPVMRRERATPQVIPSPSPSTMENAFASPPVMPSTPPAGPIGHQFRQGTSPAPQQQQYLMHDSRSPGVSPPTIEPPSSAADSVVSHILKAMEKNTRSQSGTATPQQQPEPSSSTNNTATPAALSALMANSKRTSAGLSSSPSTPTTGTSQQAKLPVPRSNASSGPGGVSTTSTAAFQDPAIMLSSGATSTSTSANTGKPPLRSTSGSGLAGLTTAASTATKDNNKEMARHILRHSAKISNHQSVCLGLLSDGPMEALRDDLLEDSQVSASTWCDLVVNLIDSLATGSQGDDALSLVEDVVLARPDVLGVLDAGDLVRKIDAQKPSAARGLTSGALRSAKVALR